MVWTLNWTVSTLAYQREKIFEKFLREKLEILKMVCSCGVGLPSLHSTNCPLQTLNILKSHFQGKKCKKYNNLTKKIIIRQRKILIWPRKISRRQEENLNLKKIFILFLNFVCVHIFLTLILPWWSSFWVLHHNAVLPFPS